MLKITSATVKQIKTMADKTLEIKLGLRELPEAEMVAIMLAYTGGEEWIEIDEIKTDGLKSPSERMRNVIYRLWEQSGQDKNFESYYLEMMVKIINMIKAKLN
jgi:hypothetical protein